MNQAISEERNKLKTENGKRKTENERKKSTKSYHGDDDKIQISPQKKQNKKENHDFWPAPGDLCVCFTPSLTSLLSPRPGWTAAGRVGLPVTLQSRCGYPASSRMAEVQFCRDGGGDEPRSQSV